MMPSTNGHGSKRAILCARVSTDEQARSGYSLAQQLEALREYASREGYEALEEVADPGQSGTSLERPGMNRVRDLVEGGGVSVVLAQDRDRFAREPAYLYLLKQEFTEYGTKIRALNDRGDDSPEGELMDGVFDQFAKFERAKTAERTRRGKLRKAREGKIIAGPVPTYGSKYNEGRDNYMVDERAMIQVKRIFHMVGVEGYSINAVKLAFDREGVPTPNGAAYWSHGAIRDCIWEDAYKPHTFEEVHELVSPDVASRLDSSRCYGVWWFGRRKTRSRQVFESGPAGTVYRKKQLAVKNPKEDWIAVPVPDSGIPREWVEAARETTRDNQLTSSAGHRTWSLSGGLFICGACGRRMTAMTTNRPNGKRYFYYRCPKRVQHGNEACPQIKYYAAEEVESEVWGVVRDIITNPEQLRADLERMIQLKKQDKRGDPDREAKHWLEKLSGAEQERRGFLRLAAKGRITDEELDVELAQLEESRKTAERELAILKHDQEQIEQLERDKDAILRQYADVTPEALDALASEERHQFYRMLRLKTTAHVDGPIEVELAGDAVSVADVSGSETTRTSG
ncbi:MAG: recombinase family protein [Actinomycetota bacterium]|nr:recombinase family protein [Actinomycetota bacterium]